MHTHHHSLHHAWPPKLFLQQAKFTVPALVSRVIIAAVDGGLLFVCWHNEGQNLFIPVTRCYALSWNLSPKKFYQFITVHQHLGLCHWGTDLEFGGHPSGSWSTSWPAGSCGHSSGPWPVGVSQIAHDIPAVCQPLCLHDDLLFNPGMFLEYPG